MNGTDLATQLRDIHLPPPVSAWPPAWGWWLVLALTVLIVILVGWRILATRQRRRLRKDALRELQQLFLAHENEQNANQLLQQCNQLLKRVAMQRFADPTIPSLHGEDWATFLADQGKRNPGQTEPWPRLLAETLYQPAPEIGDRNGLEKWLTRWIRNCP